MVKYQLVIWVTTGCTTRFYDVLWVTTGCTTTIHPRYRNALGEPPNPLPRRLPKPPRHIEVEGFRGVEAIRDLGVIDQILYIRSLYIDQLNILYIETLELLNQPYLSWIIINYILVGSFIN